MQKYTVKKKRLFFQIKIIYFDINNTGYKKTK